jgi:hypothetical protein
MKWTIALILAVEAQEVAEEAEKHCSDLPRFVRWMDEFMVTCQSSPDMQWFDSCAWVTCACLQRSLLVPVPNDEIQPCLSQGMATDPPQIKLSHETFLYAMMRTCWARTDDLAQPCGRCDMYRDERAECKQTVQQAPVTTPPTLAPKVVASAAVVGALLLFIEA